MKVIFPYSYSKNKVKVELDFFFFKKLDLKIATNINI